MREKERNAQLKVPPNGPSGDVESGGLGSRIRRSAIRIRPSRIRRSVDPLEARTDRHVYDLPCLFPPCGGFRETNLFLYQSFKTVCG